MASANNFKFECNVCGKTFTTNYNLKRHIKTVHGTPYSCEPKRISIYKCGLCDGSFETLSNFNEHIVSGHNITINNSTLQFDNQDEFLKWKKTVEEEETASYVQRHAAYSTKQYRVTDYCCNRSGNYRTAISSPSKRERHLKIQGSNKINSYCPAKIKAQLDKDGSVIVKYCSTHVGHKLELCHLQLHKDDRKELPSKIAMKIPFDAIIEDVQANLTDDIKRKHLVTKADLRNIVRDYSLDSECIRNPDDASSVERWVEEQVQSNTNCVLLYKQNGAHSDQFPQCRPDGFMLAIMSDAQADMLKKYGGDCVFVLR
ncbi:zinc finger protein 671-like [Halyomorpha halys]|uniref:zinc finger protein 671-like n=1 Tax=Halyomorpha halys TaxID=286706 RepID=UPI0006D50A50|nr:zinc finger protein 671-like [Halyomorpha halys]